MRPLAIVPTYLSSPEDLEVVTECLESLRRTAPAETLDVLAVDDCSPETVQVDALESVSLKLAFELVRKEENTGFSSTVNVGLRRALEAGQDAVLVNADLEFIQPGWVEVMQAQRCLRTDGLASVVGGLLLYPSGLIQHAGIYFSVLHRHFDHIFKYAPMSLPEAQSPNSCPVTGALQFIRHECLTTVGVYDEEFKMGWEDVDYCLRTVFSGRECVYQPAIKAWHHESLFRGRGSEKVERWQNESWKRMMEKWLTTTNLAEFCPPVA